MIRYAANLSLLWPELPFLERFEAAAQAGFTGVEILFPYDLAAKDTRNALLTHNLEMVLINAPPPNYTGGARGFAAQPAQMERFRSDMKRAFRFAEALGARFIHVMAGEAEGEDARKTMVDNLIWASENAAEGLTLTIEPLNPVAMPGYFLSDYALASGILAEVQAPNVGLQFDSYHAQMIHGNAADVFSRYADIIVHAQFGDAPDRSGPGTGAVDFAALFAEMERVGYRGWISGEYHPGGPTERTLDWMKAP